MNDRFRATRLRDSASDRAVLDALLDATPLGHFGLTDSHGYPAIVPATVVRDGQRVLAHGSPASPWMRRLAAGVPAALAVTAVDGLVLGGSVVESSVRYRSAILFGSCVELEGEDKLRALERIAEAIVPGRSAELSPPTPREASARLVLALPIEDWSLDVSEDWPTTAQPAGAWAGLVPILTTYGEPVPAPGVSEHTPLPPSLRRL